MAKTRNVEPTKYIKNESINDPIYDSPEGVSPSNKQTPSSPDSEDMIALNANAKAGKEASNKANGLDNDTEQAKPTADDNWEKLKLPKLPCRLGGTLSRMDTAEKWFSLITEPEAQDRIYIYLYRTWPRILRPKSQRYIEKVPLRLYNFNKFIANHGGGEYKIVVTDASNPNGSLFDVPFSIDTQLYEPILNSAELDLAAKENTAYIEALKNKGVLDKDGKNMGNNNQPVAASGSNNNDKLAEVLGDVVKEFLKKEHNNPPATDGNMQAITSLLIEKLKQDDPNKGLAGIADLIKAVQPQQQQGDSPMIRMLLDELKSVRESNNRLTEKFLEIQTTPKQSADSLEQIDKVLSIVDRIKHRDEDENEHRPVKQSMLDKLLDKGLPLLAPVLQGFMLKGLGSTPAANMASDLANLNEAVAGNDNPQNIDYRRNSIEAPQQTVTGNEEMNSQANQPNNPVNPQLVQLVGAYGGMLVEKILGGTSGWEFALDLENIFGNAVWKQVIQFTPDQIVAAFKSIPGFWNQIAPKTEPYIRQWIVEFIEYKKYADMAQVEDDIEPDSENEGSYQEKVN